MYPEPIECNISKLAKWSDKQKTTSIRWMFKWKFKADGSLEKHKANLVAEVYSKQPRVNSEETWLFMAKLSTLQRVLPISSRHSSLFLTIMVKGSFSHAHPACHQKLDTFLFRIGMHWTKAESNCYAQQHLFLITIIACRCSHFDRFVDKKDSARHVILKAHFLNDQSQIFCTIFPSWTSCDTTRHYLLSTKVPIKNS